MLVITLAKVKELLGITSTDFDTQISAKIPIIDAKVKQITRNNYDFKFYGVPVSGSKEMYVYAYLPTNFNYGEYSGINNFNVKSNIAESLEVGQLITGTGIAAGAYIENIVHKGLTDNDTGFVQDVVYIEMSAAATSSADSSEITAGISIGYQDIIAKGIQYLINSTSTTLPSGGVASESIGSYSYSLSSSNQKIDGKSGMPYWFTAGLPRFQGGF